MPLKFWDEAFLTATYLINRLPSPVTDGVNRLPSPVIHGVTPLEKLFGQSPNYKDMRTFGYACWPNLRPYNTHKLQLRSKQIVIYIKAPSALMSLPAESISPEM
jgi:histone deacetylase 1/2